METRRQIILSTLTSALLLECLGVAVLHMA